ncbi:hypothetical protein G7Y89_g4820 [Cudoniella acicularis]|uniref:Methyltransferase domain-containing protein n=1 Tax=Cudoniella acicularis TaxID=354080 RepID=A0A8H4RQ03_9HELO|nr:hypothetical protein G7Y89_g4820 [Cudoniella acicularis]
MDGPPMPAGINLSDNSQPRIIAAVTVSWALAISAVVLRFISRKISGAGFWWDDYFTLPACYSVSSSTALLSDVEYKTLFKDTTPQRASKPDKQTYRLFVQSRSRAYTLSPLWLKENPNYRAGFIHSQTRLWLRLPSQLPTLPLEATLPFFIHANIPSPSFLSSPAPRIADIATGTAIWLQDLADMLTPSAQLDGFDISLSQCPPKAWLSKNITLREWDMFSPVPEDLIGVYDIVHVRLLVYVMKPDNIETLARNLQWLLKPGGWLQWEELWPAGCYLLHGDENQLAKRPVMENKISELATSLPSWVLSLSEILTENGFQDVEKEDYRDPPKLARAYFDMGLSEDEEIAEVTFGGRGGGKARGAMEQIESLWKESKEGTGTALLCPKVVIVAQKKFEEVGNLGRLEYGPLSANDSIV